MNLVRYIFLTAFVIAAATAAFAQTTFERDLSTVTDDEVNAVASQMFCTECENIPLDVCGTQACIQWREEIRLQLAEGRTPEEILEYFRVNHGERALAVPGDPFLRGLTTVTPYVIAALILAGVGVFLFRWQKRSPHEPLTTGDSPPVSEHSAYLSRIEQDLNHES